MSDFDRSSGYLNSADHINWYRQDYCVKNNLPVCRSVRLKLAVCVENASAVVKLHRIDRGMVVIQP